MQLRIYEVSIYEEDNQGGHFFSNVPKLLG